MDSIRFKLSLCLVLIITLFITRSIRKGDIIDSNDFLDVALASASMILAISLIIKIFQEEQLVKLLKEDTISLLIGALAQISVSLNQEIKADGEFFLSQIKLLALKASAINKGNRP